MNWKWVIAGVFGVLLGLSIAPFEHKTILASAPPANAHFQMQDATVDESNGEGQVVLVHDVFLLDTESGNVWMYQSAHWRVKEDGSGKVLQGPVFSSIPVLSSK